MNESTTRHPLVVRYLDDLHRLLDGIEPVERAEVLDGIREHLDGSVADGASETEVRAALAELGSPESVADEAYAERPHPLGLPDQRTSAVIPATSRAWLPTIVAVLQVIAALFVLLTAAGMGGMITTVGSSGGTTVTTRDFDGGAAVLGAIAGLFAAGPFWLVVVVLVAIAGLWSGWEKFALIALLPMAAVTVGLLPMTGHAIAGITGVYVGGWTGLALAVLGGGGLLVVLTRRALRRSAALSGQN